MLHNLVALALHISVALVLHMSVASVSHICCFCYQCDKIRKQKDKFFGSFHVAHTNSLDDADDKIIRVRLAEICYRINHYLLLLYSTMNFHLCYVEFDVVLDAIRAGLPLTTKLPFLRL